MTIFNNRGHHNTILSNYISTALAVCCQLHR